MKQKILLLTLLCMSTLLSVVKANESEPNNTWDKANTLALNGNNSGVINPAGDIDWWKVKTNGDGMLSVTLSPLSGINTYVELYDTLGTIKLAGTYSTGTFTISADGLAQGTYYIKVYCYYSSDTSSYLISDNLVKPTQANDLEPDNSKSQALTLALNGSTTGHIGYYYDNYRDTTDWYKVTTNADGELQLTLNPVNGTNVYVALYDHDGTTLLIQNYSTGTFTISYDGLAAGTYYVEVYCYYNSQFAPYTLSDNLVKATPANDVEPNDTKAEALTLSLDGSSTGHVGYYYNHYRDTSDWYKVTTNADGLLRLTLTPANGTNVWVTLYDHDGTTELNQAYATGTFSISTDGLAAGTYYMRVYCYYNSQFAPYTLSDSLFKAKPANDMEPNDTKAEALTLPLDGTSTGHVGYYYNNYRDTADWYKVTTNADGFLRLTLTPANGTNVWVTLYDHDGTTELNQAYATGTFTVNTDGLAAGTYYMRVYCYYNSQFAPYTLSDSLFTYNPTDNKANAYFKQAATLNANRTTNGHVGFYYNGVRDTVDTWKINYTGTGNLKVTLNVLPHLLDGGYENTWMYIYSDTTQAPLYSAYTTGSETANLTSLAQGYYYIKVIEYYNSQFTAYTITDSFTQVNKAKIKLVSVDSAADCSGTNSITVSCSQSHSPYSVTLYRFDSAYATQNISKANTSFTFNNLPTGAYYAKVYGDGATGNAFGKTPVDTLMPVPTGLTTTNITQTSATFNWNKLSCVNYYTVEYMKFGAAKWTSVELSDTVTSYTVTGLKKGSDYIWRMNSVDSSDGMTASSPFTATKGFGTSGGTESLIAGADMRNANNADQRSGISIYPNPASSQLHIRLGNTDAKTEGKVLLALKDVSGKIVWSAENANAAETMNVDVSRLPGGIYMLQIIKEDGSVSVHKVIIAK